MHEYFEAVGMAEYNEYMYEDVLNELELNPQIKVVATNTENTEKKVELTYYVNDNLGIRACGFENDYGDFIRQSFFPFIESDRVTIPDAELDLNRRRNSDEVLLCSEYRGIGCRLYSLVQNIYEVTDGRSLKLTSINQKLYRGIALTGLSVHGIVLLPRGDLHDDELEKMDISRRKLKNQVPSELEDAVEDITLTELEIYTKIDKSVKDKGVYGVVENTFMPMTVDPDIYMVIGTIEDVREVKTGGQLVYLLDLNCCGLNFVVAINSISLAGLPKEGRRFKGNVWMQSRILI